MMNKMQLVMLPQAGCHYCIVSFPKSPIMCRVGH